LNSTNHEELTLGAKIRQKLLAGGRGKSGLMNLFCISATGTVKNGEPGETSQWQGTPELPVDYTTIQVNGMNLGADGNLWITLPDNAAPDVVVTIPGVRHFNAWPGVQEYKLKIQVNNAVTLDPDIVVDGANNFWVGQHLHFSTGFDPALPENPVYAPINWWFAGLFVNDSVQPYPNGSVNYFMNSAKLANPSQDNWWVAGISSTQFESKLETRVAEVLTFSNGQSVDIAATGFFDMYRPQLKVTTTTTSVAMDDDYGNGAFLALHYGDFESYATSGILFSNTVAITSGSIQWLQVINSSLRRWQLNNGTWLTTQNTNALDNNDPYPTDTSVNRATDSPANKIVLPSSEQATTANDSFSMFLEFNPGGGIWVPLRVVNWNWNGTGVRSGTNWSLTSDPNPDPNPPDSDTTIFPSWSNISTNSNF